MNQTLTLFGLSTTPLELISFVLSVATVWLNIRQKHWAWLFAIISSATYGVVFYGARLYGDMALQLVFISVSIWGWYQWLRGDDSHEQLPVTVLDARGRWLAALGWLLGFGALAWFLKSFTDTDVPNADGFLTAGSLVGQLLLSRKKLENWHVWIIVDVLYVALYVHKGLMLTAVLYAMFVVMAAIGLLAWRRAMDGAQEAQAAGDAMVLK
ncbi:nicotinamide riboside transporter PnuC [Massilia endophytica]|uniref:nicotinamide riboside transporter PnuC n=1 Tax=Massilia endophytica TaxID=2899220 RepID=UPI001E4666B3|nr:nicotinamide riboside transporter PnuC [Massilia endophytica]UGQ44726.1 nicotinamide riboside transporter PnuC [Massilia endophytica]